MAPRLRPRPARGRAGAALDLALAAGTAGALGATAGSFAGRLDWRLSLLCHFRPHLALGSAALLGAALARGQRRTALGAGAALGASLADMLAQPGLLRPFRRPHRHGAEVKLLGINLLRENPSKEAVLDWLAECGAQVIVATEVSKDWEAVLFDRMARSCPNHVEGPDSWGIGLAVLSSWPIRNIALGKDTDGALVVEVQHPEAPFTLIGLHAHHVLHARSVEPQRRLFRRLAAMLRTIRGPVVVAGDFNTTPWSSEFRWLVRRGGFRAPRLFRGTWPAALGPAGLPLDHVLTAGGARLRGLEPGPAVGSDHRPVMARLSVPRPRASGPG